MQLHEITMRGGEINFAPASEVEEVLQNVRTILTTMKFSVPLDRAFGLWCSALDLPDNIAQAKLTAEIVEAVPYFEPRARVEEVTYSGDGPDGILLPRVKVAII